jgi:phosphatidylglycerophosphate synthase
VVPPVLDSSLRKLIDPPLNAAGRALARAGFSANAVTLAGLALALGTAAAIASGQLTLALALLAANRIVDGLDGAVARATRLTDAGGYLDSVCDYVFYAAVPLAFAWLSPAANALPAAALLASFLLTAASFLGFATLAAKRGLTGSAQGRKSFFYSRGLIEGTETIAAFAAMLLWPQWFAAIAWTLAALCVLTALLRTLGALRQFGDP